jgi:hypothetical protein
LVQIQLLTAEDKCMSLSTLRGEHFMPHAQPLRVELNRLWDIPGREHDVIDGLDREAGSHVAIPSWDDSAERDGTQASTTQSLQKHVGLM